MFPSETPFIPKPTFGLLTLSCLLLLLGLCGCPYNSVYQLDDTPQIVADTTLYGNWAGTLTEESGRQRKVTMELSESEDAHVYKIAFRGFFGKKDKKGKEIADTLYGKMFFSELKDRTMANIRLFERNYIAEYIYSNDEISLLPLNEHFTSFIIKSNTTLRRLVTYHYDTRIYPLYDEVFCLKNMKRVTENR